MDESSPLDIEVMIAAENDPSRRATLVVLNSMNSVLVELKADFTAHRTDYIARAKALDAAVNRRRGNWDILAWVLGVAQVIGAYAVLGVKQDIKDTATLVAQNLTLDQVQETRITSIEHLLASQKPDLGQGLKRER